MPANFHNARTNKTYSQSERMDELRKVMDVARKHKVPVSVHTGSPGGYPITLHVLAGELASILDNDLADRIP